MKVLLVEPYLGGSHAAWAQGYAAASRHDVQIISHEARFWKWRMQGAALTLAVEAADLIAEWGRPDVVLVSDMLHLPAFLGATRNLLDGAPVVLYMHESQLSYPPSPRDDPDAAYGMINWASMVVAERVWFNSEFHRSVVLEELPGFLKQFPDYTHESLLPRVVDSSSVVPVGVDLSRLDGDRPPGDGAPLILWNHRWEHDKAPEDFFAVLARIADQGAEFRLAICGENFRQQPAEFTQARERFADRIVHFGWAEEADYVDLLRRADVVVSTARQEFFGISVVEAMYTQTFPLLPDRLSYPGLLPRNFWDSCLYEDLDDLAKRLTWLLRAPVARYRVGQRLALAMARYDWAEVAPLYDAELEAVSRYRKR